MIVLTGGAGFIGSCFLKKLNDENITNIIVVDNLGDNIKWKNLRNKKFQEFSHKDVFIKDLKSGKYDNNIDAIIHIGACSSTTEKNANYLFENNLNYSKILAEYAERFGTQFIYASSAATYGDGSNGYSDRDFDNLTPMNAYGMTKHLFDQWVISNELDKKFTGLKFFNVFGPNEYHKGDMASMIYKAYHQINSTGKVKLFKSNDPEYANGEQKRDFIYVKDINNILWQIFNKNNITGIYNLGTGEARTWNDLALAVFKALNANPEIEYIDMPDDIAEQYQNFTEAEMNKLANKDIEMNFLSLENAVDDYVNNHLVKTNPYF